MVKESKYCSCVMKKDFIKELVISKENYEHLESSIKCWICDKTFVEGDVKVRERSLSHHLEI